MQELRLLIVSRHALVCVESDEERRLVARLGAVCRELDLPLFTWSVADGMRRRGQQQPVYDTGDPLKALQHIDASRLAAVYALLDFHPYLAEPRVVRRLREIAQEATRNRVTLVLSGPSLTLPPELRPYAASYRLRLPDEAELRGVIRDTFRDLSRDRRLQFRLDGEGIHAIVSHLRGLTLEQARRVVSRAVLDDGVLDAADLAHVLDAKRERIEQSGVLEYFDVDHDLPELGGLANLKSWLTRFRAGFGPRAKQLGLRPPRGVMLVGVQGCGKSLAAKTIARAWELPLLRLDPGRLMDKYIGESEKNLRRALETAEAVAPVVLWIDEVEKAFAGSTSAESDAGLGRRIFGTFLTWLQEKKETVFVAATANDLSATPPELLRKGRFDEIFFIDLPNEAERRQIFSIHLALRKQDPAAFDLDALARAADGFSGAEIEQAVVAALYGLLAEGEAALTTERLLAELAATVPLSRSRREYVAELRELARERFVPAR